MSSVNSELINSISLPRLSFYELYLGCRSIEEKIGAYVAYQHLSADFFPVMQMIEVALRNSIDNTLIKSHGADWFHRVPDSSKSKQLVHLALERCPKKNTRNDIICRLPFGFWVYLLDTPYRDTEHASYIWTPENKESSFSNAQNVFGSKMSTKAIFLELLQVLDFRNRLFHHEPTWKKHKCDSHQKALDNIKKEYKVLKKVLGYLSPEKNKLIEITQRESKINTSCKTEYIHSIITEVHTSFFANPETNKTH